VVARQQLAKLVTEEESAPSWGGRKLELQQEMESLSLKYQLMSKYTTFLCINKNAGDERPTEELKEVEVVKSKPVKEYEQDFFAAMPQMMNYGAMPQSYSSSYSSALPGSALTLSKKMALP
jgi:hypothetical protein